jgi:branched-chain amino acid transport system permease protein
VNGRAAAVPAASSASGEARPRQRYWLLAMLFALALPHVPGLSSDFGRSLLTQMGIAAVFALSFNVLLGQTGLLSFGHAVYFGLGGYAAIHLMRAINQGLAVPMAMVPLAGALAGLACGALFGALTTRRAGTIFALISLGVGELVYAATFMLPGYFGGEEGITASRTRGLLAFGLDLKSQLSVYYVVITWAFLAAWLMHAFLRTPVGRMCNAVRDNPERVEFVGYHAQRVRLVAFAVAALFAGLAGGLSAINYEIVAADAVSAQRSGSVLLMAYIGGIGHFVGPVLGAITLTWLQTSLSALTSAWLLYLGLFFMVVILFAPAGLAGLVTMHGPIVRTRGMRAVLGAYTVALVPLAVAGSGAIALIEMSYRLSTQPELGVRMRILGLPLDASSPWPWAGALLALALGAAALRSSSRRVKAAWGAALQDAETAPTGNTAMRSTKAAR